MTNAAVVMLTAAKITGTVVGIMIRNEGANVRWSVNGVDPVTAGGTGTLLYDTEPLYLNGPQATAFRVIADTATGSTLRVNYLKRG